MEQRRSAVTRRKFPRFSVSTVAVTLSYFRRPHRNSKVRLISRINPIEESRSLRRSLVDHLQEKSSVTDFHSRRSLRNQANRNARSHSTVESLSTYVDEETVIKSANVIIFEKSINDERKKFDQVIQRAVTMPRLSNVSSTFSRSERAIWIHRQHR